ncbi:hypothetical protein ACPCHT_08765 [Nucisporomicrobium flavum]|uniref:Rv1733c family protein n=1 Tax=Nucisporomicrobium flavum TaxID=2785915 RepID=UPI003C2F25CB
MWRRTARRMPWRRAPLRRRSDTVQAWLTLVMIVATLGAGPWLGWWAATTTYTAQVRAGEWEREHHRPVAAVSVEDAPGAYAEAGATSADSPDVPVAVRWTGPDGAVRSGTGEVAPGTRAGSTVTVWIDEQGSEVPRPRWRNPGIDATVAGTLAVTALAAFLGGVRRIVVWGLDRRRLRSWETEWLVVGPRWSRR